MISFCPVTLAGIFRSWLVLSLLANVLLEDGWASASPVQEAVFEAVWKEISTNYYDPEFGGKDWDAIGKAYRQRLSLIEDSGSFDGLITEMLRELGESHFSLASPSFNELMPNSWRGGDAGMDLSVVGNRVIVHRVQPEGAADVAGVRAGYELVSVDGIRVADLRRQIVKSGVLKNIVPYYLKEATRNRFLGTPGKRIACRLREGRIGRMENLEVELQPYQGRMSAQLGHLAESPMAFEARKLDSSIHYLRFDLWFPSLMEEMRSIIRGLDSGTQGLIIDIRGNPGGIGLMATGLAGMLVDEEYEMGRMQLRRGHMNFNVYPQKGAYLGQVAVLIDSNSISTSEIFAADMRESGRARLFGSRTAGAALPSVFKKLPNDYYLQMAIADYITFRGNRIERLGVLPDEEVALSPSELRRGEDSVIEAARKWILRQPR
jgi:carboxyl-terminal processing protease